MGSSFPLEKRQEIRPLVSDPMVFRPFLFDLDAARQLSPVIGWLGEASVRDIARIVTTVRYMDMGNIPQT